MPAYCLPIIESSPESALALVAKHNSEYQYFEFWLDYLSGEWEEFAAEVAFQLGERGILLFRRQQLEKTHLSMEARQQIIRRVSETNALIDLDIKAQAAELAFIKRERLFPRLLLSYHNYTETPKREFLEEVLEEMRQAEADICKISCYCNTRQDALMLLDLTVELAEEGERFIILGMGVHGMLTRVFGTLWGNEMIFAPIDPKKASAPGQLNREELDAIFKVLERR